MFPVEKFGGRGGIRTHVGLHQTCFQDRRLKPLGHPSILPAGTVILSWLGIEDKHHGQHHGQPTARLTARTFKTGPIAELQCQGANTQNKRNLSPNLTVSFSIASLARKIPLYHPNRGHRPLPGCASKLWQPKCLLQIRWYSKPASIIAPVTNLG